MSIKSRKYSNIKNDITLINGIPNKNDLEKFEKWKNETVKDNLSACKIYSIFIVVIFLVLIVLLLINGAEYNVHPFLLLPFMVFVIVLVLMRNIYDKMLF